MSLPHTVRSTCDAVLCDWIWSNMKHPPTSTFRPTVSVVPGAIVAGASSVCVLSSTKPTFAAGSWQPDEETVNTTQAAQTNKACFITSSAVDNYINRPQTARRGKRQG